MTTLIDCIIVAVPEKSRQHIHMTHGPERLGRCAKLDIVVRRSGGSAQQAIWSRPEKLCDGRFPYSVEILQYAGLVTHHAGEIIGIVIFQKRCQGLAPSISAAS